MNPSVRKAFDLALGYLARRNRSILETNKYLSKKGFIAPIIDEVIQRLRDKNYLNDKIFAENYLENRKANKPKSLFAFRYELKNKGIHPTIIDQLLTEYDDLELASLAIGPKIRSWQHLDGKSLKKKVFGYLRYRGFSFSIIQFTWQQTFKSHTDPDLPR
ncbi:MAG: regulatory protein RecX [Desulfobacteraceae bacterium]|nr:regulatory protein RecX [Desulfobacteraceae bacterium]